MITKIIMFNEHFTVSDWPLYELVEIVIVSEHASVENHSDPFL